MFDFGRDWRRKAVELGEAYIPCLFCGVEFGNFFWKKKLPHPEGFVVYRFRDQIYWARDWDDREDGIV